LTTEEARTLGYLIQIHAGALRLEAEHGQHAELLDRLAVVERALGLGAHGNGVIHR
jgi:hypothetical protein